MVRLSFEDVRDYINGKNGNGCKLLSTEYKNNKTPLLIQCACGNTFEVRFNIFKDGNQRQCQECGRKIRAEKKRNNIEDVRNYINNEEGNGCKLLSTEYIGAKTKLSIQCACGKPFEVNFNNFKNGQKQCPSCGHKNQIEKQSNQVVFNCEYCGKESSVKKSHFESFEHHFCSKECKNKFHSENIKGKDNPNYNPNITDEEREKGRNIEGYTEWIKAVYEKDNYTCQCCGDNKGGNLNAHHLNGYNWDKGHRTDVDNGICLCKKCHDELHKIYGYGYNTIAQFKEFLFNKYIQSHDLKFLSLIETIDLTTRAF